MKRIVVPLVFIVLLAACGSSGGAASQTAAPGATTRPGVTTQPASTAQTGGAKVDCAKIKTAATELLSIQMLAQLTSVDAIAQFKSTLNLDTFLTAMHDLHALDAYPSALGDPKAAIDVYEKAGKAAQVLFATDPMTQAAIDTYKQNVGTLTTFLGHQVAIAGAMDAAGC